MSAVLAPPPTPPVLAPAAYRLSVATYERMIAQGLIPESDPVELIDGILVEKMPRSPRHDGVLQRLEDFFSQHCIPGWRLRGQKPLTLADSVPEPDIAIVRADPVNDTQRQPTAADATLVVEVVEASTHGEVAQPLFRVEPVDKYYIYAAAGVPTYWIVNLTERCIQVYRSPTSNGYADHHAYRPGDTLTIALDGQSLALNVADLLG